MKPVGAWKGEEDISERRRATGGSYGSVHALAFSREVVRSARLGTAFRIARFDPPVRRQSAVGCSGCVKILQTQRVELQFFRVPSQLDPTNVKRDGHESVQFRFECDWGHWNRLAYGRLPSSDCLDWAQIGMDTRGRSKRVGCRELQALPSVLGPAPRADRVLLERSGFRLRRPRLSAGTGFSAPDMNRVGEISVISDVLTQVDAFVAAWARAAAAGPERRAAERVGSDRGRVSREQPADPFWRCSEAPGRRWSVGVSSGVSQTAEMTAFAVAKVVAPLLHEPIHRTEGRIGTRRLPRRSRMYRGFRVP